MPTFPLIAIFVIVIVAFLMVRVGAIALMMTGLPRETANFQAISAFFGVGFTTREAELVVSNPVRRRIVQHLIILGNLGITSGLATFIVAILSDGGKHEPQPLEILGIVLGGVLALFVFFNARPIRAVLDWSIRQSLKRAGIVRPIDYDLMLRVMDGFAVAEMRVAAESDLVGRSLRESGLRDRGVLVLGISRNTGAYVGTPGPDDRLQPGDTLLVYGQEAALRAVGAGADPAG
ncbi:MAG: TrkA C-terminal domain-containing protein [Planctomycetota bacterium]|nr:TrkA C-terminal domain-containing protein [Planctomycetota bacterium]